MLCKGKQHGVIREKEVADYKRQRIVQGDVEILKDLCPYESCMEEPVETPRTDN